MEVKSECYCRYKINVTFYVKNSEGKVLKTIKPFKYELLAIGCDYFDSFLPNIKLKCMVGTDEAHLLSKYEKFITCSLTLYEEIAKQQDFNSVITNKVLEEMCLVYFDKSKIPRYFEESVDISKPADSRTEIDVMEFNESNMAVDNHFSIEFSLWKIESLKAKKTMYNTVLTTENEDVTVADALVFVANNSDNIKEFLYDNPDNTVTYKQIMMLPYNLPTTIQSLQQRYGIFSKGAVSFLFNNRLYVLKKYSTEHNQPKDEKKYTVINLVENKPEMAITQQTSVGFDSDCDYYVRNFVLKPVENRTALTEVFGDKLLFSNFSSTLTSTQFTEDKIEFQNPIRELDNSSSVSHEDSGVKIVPEYDEVNNSFIMNEYVQLNNNLPLNVVINAAKFSSFFPYKTIKLTTSNPLSNDRFRGDYQVSSVIYSFMFSNINALNNRADCNVSMMIVSPEIKTGYNNDEKEQTKETPK